MSTKARIAKNTAALALGNLVTKFLSFFLFVYIARKLDDASFGRFSIAMAVVGLVSVIPNYIARPFLIRETARDREGAGRILDQVAVTNIVLSLLTLVGLALVAPHLGYHPDAVSAILLLGFALVFDSVTNSYHAALAGFERMELSSMINIANTTMTVLFGGIVLFLGYGMLPLVGAYVVAKALTLVLARWSLARVQVRTGVGFNAELMGRMLGGAWPFFVTTLFVILYARLDIVMLSFFRSEQDVGYYNAAYKMMEMMGVFAASFVAAVYPVLARLFVDEPDRLRLVYRRALRYLLAFVLPAAAGLTLLANDLIPWAFGESFHPAAVALMILVWGQALDGLNPLLAQTLRATDRERTVAWITGAGALFNLIANLILIPPYGLYGASIATVASFALVFAINHHVLNKTIGKAHIAGPILRTAAASGAMALALWLLGRYGLTALAPSWRTILLVAAGCATYPLFAVLFGVLDHEDRAFLTGLLRTRLKREGGSR